MSKRRKIILILAIVYFMACVGFRLYVDSRNPSNHISPDSACTVLGENFGEIDWDCALSK